MRPGKSGEHLRRFFTSVGIVIGCCLAELFIRFIATPSKQKNKLNSKIENESFNEKNALNSNRPNTCPDDENMEYSNNVLASTAFRPALLKVLNLCDPVSFSTFAMTCKGVRNVCMNSRGIKVKFPCKIVLKRGIHFRNTIIGPGIRFKYYKNEEGNRTLFGRDLRNLIKQPFHFAAQIRVKTQALEEIDIHSLIHVIEMFPKMEIDSLIISRSSDVHCWPSIIQLIQMRGVKKCDFSQINIDQDVLRSILPMSLTSLKLSTRIPAGMLCRIGAKEIYVSESNVNSQDLLGLIQKISEINWIKSWTFSGLNESIGGSLVRYVIGLEQIPFDHEGRLPSIRPIICLQSEAKCFILTKENIIIQLALTTGGHQFLYLEKVHGGSSCPKAFHHYFM